MRIYERIIVIFVLFAFLVVFMGMTQQLPYWMTDFQKTLLNNFVMVIDMILILCAALL